MVMHHYEPDCLSKRLVCCLQGQGQLLILLQANLVWWHIIIRWIVSWKYGIALLWSRSKSQKRFRIPVNVQLDNISSAAEPSVTKLGMIMQQHGPKCPARRLVCCLQVQGHSEGSFDQTWMCWTAGLFATRFNWMVHHHKAGVFCLKIRLLFSRWRSQWMFKTWLNLYVPIIFRTTLLLATK